MYEGRSTCWLFENILTNLESVLYQIDPFEPFDGVAGDYEKRYFVNVWSHDERIRLFKDRSARVLPHLVDRGLEFDFVIVDGSHNAADVLTDAVLSWQMLKSGGVMIFDDYLWTGQGHEGCAETDKPRLAIDAFLSCFHPTVLQMGYQVAVRK